MKYHRTQPKHIEHLPFHDEFAEKAENRLHAVLVFIAACLAIEFLLGNHSVFLK